MWYFVGVELRELRSLLALAELGSISLTGGKIHLSAAAIHKQLKILEEELGVRLYEKVGRQVQLTQAAELLLPYVREMLIQHDSAVFAIEEWKGMRSGLVRVGTGPSSYLLSAILKRFRETNPGVEVVLENGNTPVLLLELQKGSLDVALIVSSDLIEARDFCLENHWDLQMVLVSHERHPLRKPHIADLKNERFILYRKGSRMQNPIDRYFAANGLEPNVIMRSDSAEFIRTLVRAGMGISMLPVWTVDKDVRDGHLNIIKQAEPPLYLKIALIRRKSGFVPKPVQAFIEIARQLNVRDLRLLTNAQPRARSTKGTRPSVQLE